MEYCSDGKGNFKHDISFGKIKEIHEKEEGFIHEMETGSGSKGAPILNLSTFKVIGMHDFVKTKNEKFGDLLYFAVNEFVENFISNKK